MKLMTKEDIMRTAFRVWSRDLYQTTSLNALAEALHVSKPAIYRHFKNKQAIIQAMYDYFFDNYASALLPDYKHALQVGSSTEQYALMARAVVRFYLRDSDAFVFALIKVYANRHINNTERYLLERGIDIQILQAPDKTGEYPSANHLIIATIIFLLACFHKQWYETGTLPSDEVIQHFMTFVEGRIAHGLNFDTKVVDALDYTALENRLVPYMLVEPAEQEKLLNVVASIVAQCGPWNASMEAVAQASGLSKSSLYTHFKNKHDMLSQLFQTECNRIAHHAATSMALSDKPEGKLYLALLSVIDYLCSRPEILVSVNWLRARYIDFNSPLSLQFFQFFSGLGCHNHSVLVAEESNHWIIFLIINTLMRRPESLQCSPLPIQSIRSLFRFICLGLDSWAIPSTER
ncbi:MAG: TetR/AcrR family transcriptional regulator [Spirochaetaceae bacterium]|jgi:AcrR family transcriptional regulator|nr:TetR/AcrR family transcriptional regulator [Spirochaetaceae bacterium]